MTTLLTLDDLSKAVPTAHITDLAKYADALDEGKVYEAAIRMRLDVSQLPKPFQINALASRDWNLSSEWFRWTLKR